MTLTLRRENVYRCSTRRGRGTGVRKIEINNVSDKQQNICIQNTCTRTRMVSSEKEKQMAQRYFFRKKKGGNTCDWLARTVPSEGLVIVAVY
jgi:hypothetical protein